VLGDVGGGVGAVTASLGGTNRGVTDTAEGEEGKDDKATTRASTHEVERRDVVKEVDKGGGLESNISAGEADRDDTTA